MYSILIVSDDNSVNNLFKKSLNGDYVIYYAKSHEDALQLLFNKDVDITFLDVLLENDGATKLLEKFKQINIEPTVVLVIPESLPMLSDDALKIGAYELLEKPLTHDAIQHASKRALEKQSLKKELGFIHSHIKNIQPANKKTELSEPGINRQPNTNEIYLKYKEVFQKFSKVLARVHDLGKLADLTVEAMSEIFGVGKAVFVLVYKKEGLSRPYRYLGIDEAVAKNISFNNNESIMLWLAKNYQILTKDVIEREVASNKLSIREAINIQREINILQASLCIPVLAYGNLSSMITLGNKITGKVFFDEDIELLSMLAGYIGMAVENAFLYREANLRKIQNENILENIPCGVIAINSNGRINAFNKNAAKMLGISSHDILGKDVKHIGSLFTDIILRTLKDKKTYEMREVTHPTTHAVYSVSTSLLDAGGELGAIMIFSDISEIKKLQLSLSAVRELEGKVKNLENRNTSSVISHELSNLLVTQPD
ncbi:Alginate biosynthesis transcriptional regulatory protein AlgB [Candidatus Brocadiaceae bacterium B188]|nr:PAS domain-containing protein [Candidatus Brocadia sapporoensis]QQR67888.1 MAG: PAS domain-containing protein [Candidatus Brocadia sp.]RZV57992.1 MAG: PAS domain-containing protein [Candidatus Brocadia sp. BROELEC01]TWU52745.1 Alginate biosynthesis transcriptional regulatory protein AlgB [Candidatus Brocadiaceae bacterium B188]